MFARTTNSTLMTVDALAAMKINLSAIHIRRLSIFTKGLATKTAMVKKLQKMVAMYRIDPVQVLEQKGVGIKTFASIHLLSAHVAANDLKAEFGVADNLSALLTVIRSFHWSVNDDIKKLVAVAESNLHKARAKLEMERLEGGLKEAVKAAKKKPSKKP